MALKLRPAEWLLAGYAGIVIAVAIARMPSYPATVWVAVAHALVLVLIGLLAIAPERNALGRALRAGAPLCVLLALYGGLDLLSASGAKATHDGLVRGWELALFGSEVSREWWRAAPSVFWSTVLHAVYFSYYLVVPTPIVWFLAKGRRDEVDRSMFAILATFVLCYLCFIFAPVAGPYYEYPRPDPAFLANWPARTVYAVLSSGSAYGAAFPSSHVAATWVAAAVGARGSRALGGLLAAIAALLTVGVVYCQMHYAVDALAGVLTAVLALGVTALVFRSGPPADFARAS